MAFTEAADVVESGDGFEKKHERQDRRDLKMYAVGRGGSVVRACD